LSRYARLKRQSRAHHPPQPLNHQLRLGFHLPEREPHDVVAERLELRIPGAIGLERNPARAWYL